LVYLFSKKSLDSSNSKINWVDTKIIFEKKLTHPTEVPEIQVFKGELTKELEELSYLSGMYSRFKMDQRFQNEEFEKLYKCWISKALERCEILIAPEMAGMVTFSLEKELGKIGLIAVSEKRQGQGWGKKLVQAVENKFFHSGVNSIQIATQESNIPAMKLYKSLGYYLVEKVFVYHYWNG